MTRPDEEKTAHLDDALQGLSTSQSSNDSVPKSEDDSIIPTWRLALLYLSLCMGLFLSLLDSSIVATALYTIGVEFDNLTTVNWVALTYILADVGFAVIFAALGDVFGRRDAYIAAFVIFIAFSLGCGFAQNMTQLLACRALQGVGGSGLYSLTFVIFSEVSPPKMRQFIGALAGAVVAVSGVLGPVLGGVITHYTTWRWCFWINGPIATCAMILFFLAYPKPHQIRTLARRSIRELDIVGCVLLIAASVLVVFAFQEGGLADNAWKSALFIAPIAIGCICWILLFGWQVLAERLYARRVAGIFPTRLLKNRVYIFATASTLLTGFPLITIIFALPIRQQVVVGDNALKAGIGLLPLLGASAVSSFIGGFVNSKRSSFTTILVIAACLLTIGCGLLSTSSNVPAVETKTYGFELLVGLGFGLTISTVTMLGSLTTQLRDTAVALGIVSQSRLLGGSIGIAASTAILGVTQRRLLTGLVTEAQLASLQSAVATFTPVQLHAVRQAYTDAFNETMWVCTAVSGVAIIAALCTYQTETIDVNAKRREQVVEETNRQRDMHKMTAEKKETC